ncbi:hypothetical protein QR680_007329 [Steinernema hermaphroditum]|uniref:Uncharacterized protein n=1 Tax=Steinernema hermaphroditum TaxID=289476 RepID=A0AA39M5U2_9BILA|nr:hypothetical protein QR680_007329 [Steinernema hermaphroditum]
MSLKGRATRCRSDPCWKRGADRSTAAFVDVATSSPTIKGTAARKQSDGLTSRYAKVYSERKEAQGQWQDEQGGTVSSDQTAISKQGRQRDDRGC